MKPADRVRFPDGVLKFDLHRGGNCWSLHLALNQANTGSIPVLGAVARSGAGFQRLTVNEFVAGSIPVGHPCNAAFDYWLGRLLLRQQEGDRYSYAVLASNEAIKRRGRFCWQNRLVFIQEFAGSIPAHVTASNRNTRKSPGRMRTLS